MSATGPRVWLFVTPSGQPVAEYDGDEERLPEACDEAARVLGVPLAVIERPAEHEQGHRQ